MSDDFAWMDAPAEERPVSAATQKQVTKVLGATVVADRRHAKLVQDMRKLTHRQRVFIRFLLANEMHPPRAVKAMNAALGTNINRRTATRWLASPLMKSVVERISDLALEAAGVGSPTTTLLRIDSVIEDALVPVPILFKGEDTGFKEVDRGNALKGLELLGKAQHIFKGDDDKQTKVVVHLDFSGEVPGSGPIEGEFVEVKE